MIVSENINKKISKIGQQLVNDHPFYSKYSDIICNPEKGIVPRCLSYESEHRDPRKQGSVIVGLNPGSMKRFIDVQNKIKSFRNRNDGLFSYHKIDGYLKKRFMFDDINNKHKAHPYYRNLRNLVNQLKLDGPILWTEIVKCESKMRGKLSVRTIRDDINRYLLKEIDATPTNWPLIGVGDEAYKILSYYFNKRLVIGVPHVTGVRNNRYSFNQLVSGKKDDKKLKLKIKRKISKILKDNLPVTVRLIDLKQYTLD